MGNYKIDVYSHTHRDLYLMWLIHVEPMEFQRQNNLVFKDGYAYLAPTPQDNTRGDD